MAIISFLITLSPLAVTLNALMSYYIIPFVNSEHFP